MTSEEITSVVEEYAHKLRECNVKAKKADVIRQPTYMSAIDHALWIAEVEIPQFIAMGKISRAQRCLGFLQGILWIRGIYAIEHINFHNHTLYTEDDEIAAFANAS